MSDLNYNPNARFDMGPNAAGCGRQPIQSVLGAMSNTGIQTDGTEGSGSLTLGNGVTVVAGGADVRLGFSARGVSRNNPGPNVAGAPRSINDM
jgi:hypothetical protein